MRGSYSAKMDSFMKRLNAPPIREAVDLGCATGLSTLELQRSFPEAQIIGVRSQPALPCGCQGAAAATTKGGALSYTSGRVRQMIHCLLNHATGAGRQHGDDRVSACSSREYWPTQCQHGSGICMPAVA